jgi:hypothetical protein
MASSPPTQAAIAATDIAVHVAALTAPAMEGRLAGSPGEQVAAAYLKHMMERLRLAPVGEAGDFLHAFEFISGVDLGPNNTLAIRAQNDSPRPLVVQQDWRPIAFSRSDPIEEAEIVFAGYGIVAPEGGGGQSLDDYARVDVQDRWALVFRGMPGEIEGERRQHLQLYVSLRHKAMIARDHGARGILFVSGPLGQFREELVPLRFDASLAGTRIGAISLSDAAAQRLLAPRDAADGTSLAEIQAAANQQLLATLEGHPTQEDALSVYALNRATIRGQVDLETIRSTGHNVVGRLQVGDAPSPEAVVLGAHFDHLGFGETGGSLASGSDIGQMHPGADDNASGVAALLEVAEALVAARDAAEAIGRRDFIFAAWSGEELGLLGSDAWAREHVNPHSNESSPVAYLNFDMVGRLQTRLIVQGLGSSPDWKALLDAAAARSPLEITSQQDAYLPTDVTSFYTQGVPVLAAFTGVHSEYHTPQDQAHLLNLAGTGRIANLFMNVASAVSRAKDPPTFQAQERPARSQTRSGFRVFLGTIPDYAQTDLVGVRLSGVAPAGPAEQAGIQGGDIIIETDGRMIENLYDYTYALQALRVGEAARIVVMRGAERLSFEVVPTSRD